MLYRINEYISFKHGGWNERENSKKEEDTKYPQKEMV